MDLMNNTNNNENTNHEVKKKRFTLGIRGRLFAAFAIMGTILIAAVLVILVFVTASKRFATDVISEEIPNYNYLTLMESQIFKTQSSLQSWLLTNDPKYKSQRANAMAKVDNLQVNINRMYLTYQNSVDIQKWQQIKTLLNNLKTEQLRVENLSDKKQATTELINGPSQTINKITTLLYGTVTSNGIINSYYDHLKNSAGVIIYDMNLITNILIGLILCSFFCCIIIALATSKKIIGPISMFRLYSSKVASGDLTQRLNIDNSDELGKLGHDLNTMTQGLANITMNIARASNLMTDSLDEVKRASDQQSAGVSQQAASINQITASLEEIDKSAAQTMEKAKALGELATSTNEKGQIGLQAVFESIEGMKDVRSKVEMIAKNILDLSNQTQQVGEITAVVNTLAQQSKMLALNASIEAAKAGDSGKGFAVVATEIKNLAEQSEQSTVEVQRILEDIRRATEKAVLVTEEGTKGVDQGTTLVEQMGDVVRSLTQAISETKIASQQIEAAVRQESLGIEQITTGMNEINQVTSSFVSTVRQTSASITKLSSCAKNIKEYVDIYKVS